MTIYGGQLVNGLPAVIEINRDDDHIMMQIRHVCADASWSSWFVIPPAMLAEMLDEMSGHATAIADLLSKRQTVRGNAPKYRRVRGERNG